MTTCATCARALEPAWRFCIYCGTPVPVAETVPDAGSPVSDLPDDEPLDEEPLDDESPDEEDELVDYDAETDDLEAVDGVEEAGHVEDEVVEDGIVAADEPQAEPEAEVEPEPERELAPEPEPEPEPVPAPVAAAPVPLRSRPMPAPVDLARLAEHPEPAPTPSPADEDQTDQTDETDDDGYPFDDEPIDLPDEDGARPSIASLAFGSAPASAPAPTPASDQSAAPVLLLDREDGTAATAPRVRTGSVNVLAIVALVLGVLVSPLAALFGHLALNQLKTSGEKGVIPAWIAVVLGYVWLGAAIVLGITYLATNV